MCVCFYYREPVKCGDTIRLHHLATNKNLHSHHFQSPLSGNQEISAYGDEHGKRHDTDLLYQTI